jgi:3-oxoacyl-[acyl-carrier-protein] synthase II
MQRAPVSVTGVGILTPLGATAELTWRGLIAGRVPTFEGTKARIPDFAPGTLIRERKLLKMCLREAQLGIVAGLAALDHAGLGSGNWIPEQAGVFTGCGGATGGLEDIEPAIRCGLDSDGRFDLRLFSEQGALCIDPMMLLRNLPNGGFAHISRLCQARGANQNYMTGSLAGSQAVQSGVHAIQRGEIKVAVAGGFESSDARPSSQLPTSAGEGAGMLAMESSGNAQARGVTLLARIASSAGCTDHLARQEPERAPLAANRAIRLALERAGIIPSEVGFIVTTAGCDFITQGTDGRAVDGFWHRAPLPPVCCLRSSTGYLGAAAGPVALGLSALGLFQGDWPAQLPDKRAALVVDTDLFGRSVAFVLEKASG